MNQQELKEKLQELKTGQKVTVGSKTYEVIAITYQDNDAKLNRTDIAVLEPGKSKTEMVEGKFLNAGKMIEVSNVRNFTVYAQKAQMERMGII